ncbi:YdhK family protein [Carnobacterium funditum]|uniref:YdhK family protein n=1 Tax=Carnobacterium funditum TaxID=2752 RepID=UPI00054CDF8E|nr:YdhK family protein [Carnobacterium funditum]
MKKKKIIGGAITLSSLALLVACAPQDSGNQESVDTNAQSSIQVSESSDVYQTMNESDSMKEMEQDDSGEILKGLQKAENPTYVMGDTVILQTDHMEGMKGATGTIVGAYDTVVYEVTYEPTNGDSLVENHKWVLKEEIPEARSQEEPLNEGTEVTLEASHMEGMEGATATINSAEETTVYMLDYQPTDGGETVKNHKWVTEDELSKK